MNDARPRTAAGMELVDAHWSLQPCYMYLLKAERCASVARQGHDVDCGVDAICWHHLQRKGYELARTLKAATVPWLVLAVRSDRGASRVTVRLRLVEGSLAFVCALVGARA